MDKTEVVEFKLDGVYIKTHDPYECPTDIEQIKQICIKSIE